MPEMGENPNFRVEFYFQEAENQHKFKRTM